MGSQEQELKVGQWEATGPAFGPRDAVFFAGLQDHESIDCADPIRLVEKNTSASCFQVNSVIP